MSVKNNLLGYKPSNPYQCPTNFLKPEACASCEGKTVCQETYTIPTGSKLVGFTHTSWVSDDCVDVGDGIVNFKCGVVDLATADAAMLTRVVFNELRTHEIPECQRLNDDISTMILQCETLLDVTKNDDGSFTVVNTGQESITSFILEDLTPIEADERLCTIKTFYTYEALVEGAVQADIEASIVGTFESVEVVVGFIPVNGDIAAIDKVIIVTCDNPFDVDATGLGLELCKEESKYVSDEEVTGLGVQSAKSDNVKLNQKIIEGAQANKNLSDDLKAAKAEIAKLKK